jgi:hypothetical protein
LRPSADRKGRNEKTRLKLARLDHRKAQKNGFDRPVTVQSNCGLMFVINKSSMPGGGLAEERRQRAAGIGRSEKPLATKDTKEHKGKMAVSLGLNCVSLLES